MNLYEILDTKMDIKLVSNHTNSYHITYQTVLNDTTYKCEFDKLDLYQIKDILANILDVVLTSDFDLKYDDEIISDEHAKQLQYIKSNISKYKNLWLISFYYMDNDDESNFDLTNKYIASKVFGFVKQSFEMFKQTKKIKFICFESNSVKRTNLYKKFLTKFLNIKSTFEINYKNKTFIIMEI